jgi:hypothetical protein
MNVPAGLARMTLNVIIMWTVSSAIAKTQLSMVRARHITVNVVKRMCCPLSAISLETKLQTLRFAPALKMTAIQFMQRADMWAQANMCANVASAGTVMARLAKISTSARAIHA